MTQLVTPVNPDHRLAFVQCRSEGHEWRHTGRVGGSDPDRRPPLAMYGSVGVISICASCATERIKWYTRSGEVVSRYRHPEGYLHDRRETDQPAPSRLEWRQSYVTTLFADFTAAVDGASKRGARRA